MLKTINLCLSYLTMGVDEYWSGSSHKLSEERHQLRQFINGRHLIELYSVLLSEGWWLVKAKWKQ